MGHTASPITTRRIRTISPIATARITGRFSRPTIIPDLVPHMPTAASAVTAITVIRISVTALPIAIMIDIATATATTTNPTITDPTSVLTTTPTGPNTLEKGR